MSHPPRAESDPPEPLADPPKPRGPQIPSGVWVLGGVSLLMDTSSEMIHSLLPLFMVFGLGASTLAVGVIEGLAEATALIVKVFSGALSDYLGKRKGLAVVGYGLGALSKPLFALAPGLAWVVTGRLVDRVGKGIRGAPRDALIADLTPLEIRGAAFGARQSLDTVGAFVGPLLAVALMWLFADDFRLVFWAACVPGLLAVMLLTFGLREPQERTTVRRSFPIQRHSLARLPSAYWRTVGVAAIFSLARFSEAFLVLRAEQVGIELRYVPLVMVAMNVVYALSAYPFGRLADRVSQQALLQLGLLVMIIADLALALSQEPALVMVGVALWGIHMGMTQGLLATMIAGVAPGDLRGSAFGCFSLVCGLSLLVGSAMAGWVWGRFGAPATFYLGAIIAAVALCALFFGERTRASRRR